MCHVLLVLVDGLCYVCHSRDSEDGFMLVGAQAAPKVFRKLK